MNNFQSSHTAGAAALLFLISALVTSPAWAQKTGQSVSIQYGTVTGGRQVDLKSGAVPGGAVVGGTLGLLSAGGKSTGKKVRNTLIGGIAGGAIAGGAQGSTMGMLYEVDLGAGGRIQVVTDQREVRTGDCVAVEKAGETANIRRVSSAYCNPDNSAAVAAVAPESKKDADECVSAKQQLVDASTAEQLELASKKIELLCND